MLRITRGEESKLTSWYFEIDKTLLKMIFGLMFVGLLVLLSAGSADAIRLGHPWYFFIKKAFLPYTVGLMSLFVCSIMNKKQIIKLSFVGIVVFIAFLFLTIVPNPLRVVMNGSNRWIKLFGSTFMPSDFLKPFFIMVTAWFLSKTKKLYGSDIFFNKDAWNIKKLGWIPYLVVFLVCVLIMVLQPDFGTSLLYIGVLGVMLFVAGFPIKFLPWVFGVVGGFATLAIVFLPQLSHIRDRMGGVFHIAEKTQAWYSVNAIRNGGLFGSGDKAFVKYVLPEATNDFVFASIAEDVGALVACCLIVLLFLVFKQLIKHATFARDDFVVYAVSGAAALFGIQVCFNLMTALHLFINKGMTLPFVSYGGISFIVFCILFGMVLAITREDTWNK